MTVVSIAPPPAGPTVAVESFLEPIPTPTTWAAYKVLRWPAWPTTPAPISWLRTWPRGIAGR